MKTFKHILTSLSCLTMALSLSCCSETAPEPTPEPNVPDNETPIDIQEPEVEDIILPTIGKDGNTLLLSKEDSAVAEKTEKFAWNIMSSLAHNTATEENILFSPLSASLATSLVANATAGNTFDEIINVLGFEEMNLKQINEYNYKILLGLPFDSENGALGFANSLFLKPEVSVYVNFLLRLQKYYDAELFQDNFSIKDINNWAYTKTNGLISELLDENSDMDFDFAMLNSIYFKANWTQEFSQASNWQTFTNADGSTSEFHAIFGNTTIDFFEDEKIMVAGLSYKIPNYKFSIIMPQEGVTIPQTIEALQEAGLNNILNNSTRKTVALSFPEFKLQNNMNIKDVLIQLGIIDAYNEKNADFSNMTHFKPTYLKQSIQANSFSVDKYGSEGASVTIHEGDSGSVLEPYPSFKANRPFIFALSEKSSGAILYLGCINKLPETSSVQ